MGFNFHSSKPSQRMIHTACLGSICNAGKKARARALVVFIHGLGIITGGITTVHADTVTVGTVAELRNAVASANDSGGNKTILVKDGTYTLTDTLYIKAPNVTISGQSGIREKVIIQGDAMSASAKVGNVIRVSASYFTISNLTLQKSGWHLLQISGENDADNAVIRNVIFRDAYQQMLKVSIDQSNYAVTGDNGLIENSLFEYQAGIGPQYYIGGIDVHGGKNWVVRNNTFRSIVSPNQEVAEFAIHFWNQSADALVEKNLIINCDRGIGFGLDGRGNARGIIRNNMIYHAANIGPFQDVGIYLDQSPGTQIYNNTIFMENPYPRSIEYRFAETTNVLITNNLTNKPIAARDGASGTVKSNVETASSGWFVNPSQGNLHLTSVLANVVDAGQIVSGLSNDFDGQSRPQGAGIDIGADEFTGTTVLQSPKNLRVIN
jgi:hypothetical protein